MSQESIDCYVLLLRVEIHKSKKVVLFRKWVFIPPNISGGVSSCTWHQSNISERVSAVDLRMNLGWRVSTWLVADIKFHGLTFFFFRIYWVMLDILANMNDKDFPFERVEVIVDAWSTDRLRFLVQYKTSGNIRSYINFQRSKWVSPVQFTQLNYALLYEFCHRESKKRRVWRE